MIIVSGKIFITPGQRDAFLRASYPAIIQARSAPGCRDFVVSADPVEENRVNVYEAWDSVEELDAFRGSGPDDGLSNVIVGAEVARHIIASSGPA